MKICSYAILIPLMFTAVAFANPTVNTPSNGAYVSPPFTLSASSATCSSQPVNAMAYSIDSGADLVTVNSQSMDVEVTVGTGKHTVHVKSWGNKGAGCDTDVVVNVTTDTSASSGNPAVNSPSNGEAVSSPFTLSASSSTCSSQPVSAMAYSIDSGADLVTVNAKSLDVQVSSAPGAHAVHVKSWGNKGAGCSTNVAVNVTAGTSGSGGVNVNSPFNGETVNSPLTLSANSATCSSQPVSAMAYSIDSGSNLFTANAQTMKVQVMSGTGGHTLHVKSWGNNGAGCVTNVAVNVATDTSTGPYVPSNAIGVSSIQTLKNWTQGNDPANGGWSSGKMSMVGSPAHSGTTRQTVTNYSKAGGERYWVSFGDDTQSTNFVYDGWVYLSSTDSQIANLEMDMNQVMRNGQTVIFGFECDGYNNTWDYTMNTGTPDKSVDTWVRSKTACNLSSWSRNTWHHVQVEYSRNDSGAVTYQAVYLDGVKSTLNVTVPSAFALGWAPSLLTNLQVDGRGSGGWLTVYLDDLTIYRW